MTESQAPSRLEAFPAYLLSAVTTLLWVACVLPSGTVAQPAAGDDAATPLYREAILLVPALLLLVAVPAGCTLSRRRRGLRAVLASTDAFIVLYAAAAMWAEGLVFLPAAGAPGGARSSAPDVPLMVASAVLVLLGALSILEVRRCASAAPLPDVGRRFSGLRLAICLLVLVVPLHVMVRPNVERASLLAPFLFVALSAGGARLARDMHGLRRTAAVLQLLLAAHVLVTVRYTIFRSEPAIVQVNPAGRAALGLAIVTACLALLQVLVLARRGPARALEGQPAPAG